MPPLKTGEQVFFNGFAFPFRFEPNGRVAQIKFSNEDTTLLKKSLEVIALVSIGETTANRRFGTGLLVQTFDGADIALSPLVQRAIIEAVTTYEPRVEIVNITVDTKTDPANADVSVQIKLEYLVKALDKVDSLTLRI